MVSRMLRLVFPHPRPGGVFLVEFWRHPLAVPSLGLLGIRRSVILSRSPVFFSFSFPLYGVRIPYEVSNPYGMCAVSYPAYLSTG